MKSLRLKTGKHMPIIGFGTWQLKGEEAYESVSTALEVGYRHLDTADRYGNHREVGKALADSGVKREDVYLTSKIWRENFEPAQMLSDAQRFLEELQVEYLDMLLLHWPNKAFDLEKTLSVLQEIHNKGITKDIGVSNFTIQHLEKVQESGVQITNNQVEFHPSLYQHELLKYCHQHKLVVTAYSPLAQGRDMQLDPVTRIAKKRGVSPAQVVLNWLMCKNIVVIPRSSSKEHIKDNFQSQDFELTVQEIDEIDDFETEHIRIVDPHYSEFQE